MGLPLIGEVVHLLTPSYSLDLHPFVRKRLERYGPIFWTSLVGKPVLVTDDPEFKNYVIQQEGRMVELRYLDTFAKLFVQEGESWTNQIGVIHKYARSIFMNHLGAECINEKLLPQIEESINKHLCAWSSRESVEVKHAGSVIHKKATTMLRAMLRERRSSPEKRRGDFLDQIIDDLDQEKFLSEDFCIHLIFGGLFAIFESISTVLTLFFSLLADHPAVLQELTAEHEALLKNREDPNSALTWDEYKSMTFTLQVINETLRLTNTAPGLLRRALKDIPVKGYTIPAGWTILLVTPALHLTSNTFKDHLEFNPWRWKDLDSLVISKNFMPFGSGLRQCAGAEFSRAYLSTFLHVLVTKYRWTTIKGARISRRPMLTFGDGAHIKFSEKKN
ncbi:cytochrome P450 87A3-like [Pyrus ussuriensis x Pyrus communis]|uniref:Cytochrome P450 87A3-like n=1 Tax=Pyrus ussuriensis x Pyrus communis TaxID=2448454 RepID=A0A5N5FMR5_9ROSA|nr:cytochrome P450 87A3-like [Pyrus ussuriensis x Pyrus communis]